MKDKFEGNMKRRLMLSVFAALVFMLIFTTVIFYTIITCENQDKAKRELNIYTYLVEQHINDVNPKNYNKILDKFDELGIRVTIINKDGVIEFDSAMDEEKLTNHNDRYEIIMARKDGEGSATRYSATEGKDVIYYAKEIESGEVIRTSRAINDVKIFNSTYLLWYCAAIIVLLGMSFWIASKLSYIIVKPIQDLDLITSMITKGELSRRVNINSNDELGLLASNFNYMADKLEKSLHEVSEKQNRLSAILQSMDSGVIAIDNNHNVIIINNYAKKLFNIMEDVVGEKIENICEGVDFKSMFSMRDREFQEFRLRLSSVKVLRVRNADIIIDNHQHIGVVAVIQDITDLKKLENMRTDFVANVSHELKTPLTSIRGFAETLKDVDDDETKNKFLNIINEEAERLTRLISDILLLSQIEQKQEFKKEVFDVNKVIEDVFVLMKNTGDQKNVHITVVGDELPNILGDSDKFKQMLINLVDNGIKYSEPFDTVTVTKIEEDRNFKIIVEDTGMGIDSDFIPRLFERFYRVDKARSRAKGGTGLGLAIVKHIVIGFNGNIEVQSTLGVGTKFILTIPYSSEN